MIKVLSKETIDRISAGEVVERPSNVVKELVENAIDSGATAITVEIKAGGLDLIRVTDNGSGIETDQMKTAFLRHATSKIEEASDLDSITTLGFRGEALASICAVSETEMISALPGSLTGNRLIIRGGDEISFEEIGAPSGTTVIVRNLFYNTPARKKFLKTNSTEGSYVAELMEKIALSHPEISFQYSMDNRSRFHTSGNGDLMEVIFRVFGRETAGSLVPISAENDRFKVSGFLGKPEIIRSNRNMEIYFLNGRYVKNNFISTAVEEGYREYLMLHKFPVVFLNFTIDPSKVDVNVHPAKLDVRISDQQMFFAFVSSSIHDVMTKAEMIPENILTSDADKKAASKESAAEVASGKNPEPFELKRTGLSGVESAVKAFSQTVSKPSVTTFNYDFESEVSKAENVSEDSFFEDDCKDVKPVPVPETETEAAAVEKSDAEVFLENTSFKQSQLFEDHLLDRDKRSSYKIIGQVFDTYWIVQYEQQMFIIDQHAAHEKVNYERFVKRIHAGEHPTQMLMPPIIVTLTGAEEAVLNDNIESFRNIGFEIENFGGNEYALRGVPTDLFRHSEKELFLAILDELAENPGLGSFKTIDEKIAGMACKASVKGGDRIGIEQAQKLIDELLTLDNPYNCPHGRPTIISITKTEMEKKFQRIVN